MQIINKDIKAKRRKKWIDEYKKTTLFERFANLLSKNMRCIIFNRRLRARSMPSLEHCLRNRTAKLFLKCLHPQRRNLARKMI